MLQQAPEILRTLPGPSALTEFEAARLLSRLQAIDPGVTAVEAAYLYVLDRNAATATPAEAERLIQLLGTGVQIASGPRLWIGPRAGIQSPWSSKATDILRNTGFDGISRIERFRVVRVDGATSLAVLADLLHDRMTETVSVDSLETLLSQSETHARKPLAHIDVMTQGAAAIEAADRELGLSLAPDEILYLADEFKRLGRNPSDVELYMFAQANSEHCRHKIFNATWTIDGIIQPNSLFQMIRNTNEVSGDNVLSAYRDNAAVIRGSRGGRFFPSPESREYAFHQEDIDILIKVETHNHPTAISPWAGAATGAGGEIRDEGATGRGGKPKAGLAGFTVSNLNLPQAPQPWEVPYGKPAHIASPLDIMIDAPLGAAAYNNEFGRPNLCGYFRTFEQTIDGKQFGYHKPIMLAGGLGNIRTEHIEKGVMRPGYFLVALGGPSYLIGLGGGAASSSSSNRVDLDYASVQRDNAEMERRAQEVIDQCWHMGNENPIAFIHDVGAGGFSNAFPELIKDGGCGGIFSLNARTEAPDLSPLEQWCNESQERYVLAIAPDRWAEFVAICHRERCPVKQYGVATEAHDLKVAAEDVSTGEPLAIDLPLQTLFGKPPKMERSFEPTATEVFPLDLSGIELSEAIELVLRLPAVASKSFLITIGDRTVGGLTVQDQMVGPWQVPVADCAVTSAAYDVLSGEAMAIGERTPLAVFNAAASARMAIGEVITNMAGAAIAQLSDIKLSANWMAAAGEPGEDQKLFEAVYAVGMEFCPALGITIPVGKDSMSMRMKWTEPAPADAFVMSNESGALQSSTIAADVEYFIEQQVVSPLSLIVSGFSPVSDVTRTLTPELKPFDSGLLLIDLGEGLNRMGGSALAHVSELIGGRAPDAPAPSVLKAFFATIQQLNAEGKLLAYHDRSDGGVLVTLLEMAFAGRTGLDILITGDPVRELFNEELGAIIQVPKAYLAEVETRLRDAGLRISYVADPKPGNEILIGTTNEQGAYEPIYKGQRTTLHKLWSETSFHIASLRDNPASAAEEFMLLDDATRPGLTVSIPFPLTERVNAPFVHSAKPRIAILREQGVNGQLEMAAAFDRSGFTAVDVHMSDLLAGRAHLSDFTGLAACGGFSYGDVLGAGSGWAKTILFNEQLKEMFAAFFSRPDTFSLGVCNGCQMMAQLRDIVPGASHWPTFQRNLSSRYEARLCMVEIEQTPSILLDGMAGARVPIVVAHGEGRVLEAAPLAAMRYIDTYGHVTQHYPLNPNGSASGIAGFTTTDGRALILMPHPERIALGPQHTWTRDLAHSPWQRIFDNARKWVG